MNIVRYKILWMIILKFRDYIPYDLNNISDNIYIYQNLRNKIMNMIMKLWIMTLQMILLFHSNNNNKYKTMKKSNSELMSDNMMTVFLGLSKKKNIYLNLELKMVCI